MIDAIGPVLITGGNGFLGKALSAALLAAGEDVVALDLELPAAGDPAVTYHAVNILDTETLSAVARQHEVRAIVHLAAMVIPMCKADPIRGAQVNIIGHINLLEVARELDIRRFVYTSSIAARARPPHNSPVNLYGAYKRACEDISKIWHLDHGIPSIGLRPNVVYGPGREQGETAAITQAIKAAAQGSDYRMPFSGAMCFQYVDEVTDIVLRCLRTEPATPVVSDLTTTTETTDDVIAAIRLCAPQARILPSKYQRAAPPSLDNTPLLELIGQWHTVGIQEGVNKTFEYYRSLL